MKRSQANALIAAAIEFCRANKFYLPPFAQWSPEEWHGKGHEADEIRDCMLGWDLCDFALGKFHECGLVLFTIRNGHPTDPRYPKTYCEKLLIQEEGQYTPMHFHWQKCEDIINRGGGNLVVQLYNADAKEGLAKTDVQVSLDGVVHTVKAGGTVTLRPGESITLRDHVYHKFWGEPGRGTVLLGEVSMVNDDKNDNRFHEKLPRFPTMEEDEPARYLLVTEYPAAP